MWSSSSVSYVIMPNECENDLTIDDTSSLSNKRKVANLSRQIVKIIRDYLTVHNITFCSTWEIMTDNFYSFTQSIKNFNINELYLT